MKIDHHDASQTRSIKMIASARRKARAIELRDLALKVIQREGKDGVISRIPVKSVRLEDLEMMYIPQVQGEALLDVWTDKKVFSIRWDKTGRTDIVNYKPGFWETALAKRSLDG
jgi:hypothetical protein